MDKQKKNSNIYTITDPLLTPYYVQFDSNCYTVIKTVVAGTTGKEREQTMGYYSSLESCLNSIAEDSIKNQDYTSLQDFISAYKKRLSELKQISLQ